MKMETNPNHIKQNQTKINLGFEVEKGANGHLIPLSFASTFATWARSDSDEERINTFLEVMNTFASCVISKRYIISLSFHGNNKKTTHAGQVNTPASIALRQAVDKFVVVQNRRVGEVNVIPQLELIEDIGKVDSDNDETLLNSALSSFFSQEYNKQFYQKQE